MKKIVSSMLLCSMLLLGTGSAFAASIPEQSNTGKAEKKAARVVKFVERAKEKGITVEELKAKIDAEKQKAEDMGLSWKEYKAQAKTERADKKAERQAKLEEIAKEKGLSVATLKAERKARIEKIAKEKGITVEELKAERKVERATRREKAEDMGISLKEYRDQLKADKKEEREGKLVERAQEKGITVEELKAQRADRREKAKDMGLSMKAYRTQLKAERQSNKQQ